MEPATKEFFQTVALLKDELLTFKAEQSKLRLQISRLFEENKQLSNELKENVRYRLQQLSESDIGELENKLQAAVASKNSAIEMWQAALRELEKQEEMLIGRRSIVASERSELEKEIYKIKEEYTKGLNVLSEELSHTRNELVFCKKELEDKKNDLDKFRKAATSAKDEIIEKTKMIEEFYTTKHEMEEKISSLESLLSDAEDLLSDSKKEITALKSENWKFSSFISDLKEENKKLKTEILSFERDAKESFLTAQEAVLQKKEMAFREEQYKKDIELMKVSIDMEIEKVSIRYKAEIKNIQEQAAEKVKNLMEEIQNLHRENSEKQSMFEKTLREKQALESKADLLYSENSNNIPISGMMFEDMSKRLIMAERGKDKFELKYASLEKLFQEFKSSKEAELQYLQAELSSVKERSQKLLEDFNQASSDRIKLSDEVAKLKKKCLELEKELKLVTTKNRQEISALEVDSRRKLQSYHEQLQITETRYKAICTELQKLLDEEFKISSKWKNEVENLISKSEMKIEELCQTINYLKNQNSELVNILKENNIHIHDKYMYTSSLFPSDI